MIVQCTKEIHILHLLCGKNAKNISHCAFKLWQKSHEYFTLCIYNVAKMP